MILEINDVKSINNKLIDEKVEFGVIIDDLKDK